MELSKVVLIGAIDRLGSFKPQLGKQRLFLDVVFIDKTHQELQPLLYQLKQESLNYRADEEFRFMQRDAFIMIGEVIRIDKQNKQIILSNDNVVSYNQLIIASGSKSGSAEEDFSVGFRSFVEAIKVQKNIASFKDIVCFKGEHEEKKCLSHSACTPIVPTKQIEQLILSNVLKESMKPVNLFLGDVELSLYEYQI